MTPSYQRNFYKLTIGLGLLSCAIFVFGLMLGAISISDGSLAQTFALSDSTTQFILSLRLNREIVAFACGGMLAMGSAILQGLTRNTMVAPDLAGMTSLGCLLIVICELFWFKSIFLNLLLGTVGAVFGFVLCLLISNNHRTNSRLTIILAGICISFTATAVMQLFILHSSQNIDAYLNFLNGSLYAMSSAAAMMVFIAMIILVPITFILGKHFSVFSLDNQTCHSIGVPVRAYKFGSLLTASLLIGVSVTGVGNMGFLGIVAPNIGRLAVGNRPYYILPLSFLIGGLMYLFADLIGHWIISPAEIPAGIMTNMISAPLFLYILLRYYRGQHEWN